MSSDVLTAREAAEAIGVSERTMRRLIAAGRVPGAHKTAPNRYAIPAEALQTARLGSHALPVSTAAALRREVDALRARVAIVESRLDVREAPPFPMPDLPPLPRAEAVPRPSVSHAQEVKLSAWADRHGVPRRTAMDQAERGEIPAYRRASAARPHERPHYLTPEGQAEAVRYWSARAQGASCGDPGCVCAAAYGSAYGSADVGAGVAGQDGRTS